MKECYACGEARELTEFNRRKRSRDGLDGICKPCDRARNQRYRRENADRLRGYEVRRYAENRERRNTATRRWRAENPDKLREYREARPEPDWLSKYRRRCAEYGVEPRVSEFTRDDVVAHWGNGWRCIYCDRPATGIDHLIPVAEGGAHEVENAAPCCLPCNRVAAAHVAAKRVAA